MLRWLLAGCALLTGCGTYLGTAVDWDPRTAETGFLLIPGLTPIRQEDSAGCGAAVLAMVLRYHGDSGQEWGTPEEDGVTAGALRDRARARGFKAHVLEGTVADLEEQLRKRRPLIVGLVKPFLSGARPHYEVVAGIDPNARTIATIDPARGWTLNSFEGFLREWDGSGRLLLIVAPGQQGGGSP